MGRFLVELYLLLDLESCPMAFTFSDARMVPCHLHESARTSSGDQETM